MKIRKNKSFHEWLRDATLSLSQSGETPRLEAELILAKVIHKDRAWVIAHPEAIMDLSLQLELNDLLERRKGGEPLPYLLGRWEFYGASFEVNESVLIPRPETELLIDLAVHWISANTPHLCVDIGTGSGCIAITLAKKYSHTKWVAIDISFQALQTAKRNAQSFGVQDQISFLQADLLSPLTGPVDLICGNLPYIPSDRFPNLKLSGFEPQSALDGGQDGMEILSALINQLPKKVHNGSLLLLEIDSKQSGLMNELLHNSFSNVEIQIIDDLASLPRIICAKFGA